MWAGKWPLILKLRNSLMSNFCTSRFLISVLVFVSRDFELGRVSVQFMLFAIAITFARWRRRSEATVSPGHTGLIFIFQHTVKPLILTALNFGWPGWLSGRMSVSDRRTFTRLQRTCSWWVTIYMGKPSAVGEPTQPFILMGSINK